ncbi:methyltransferase domain-containing protein [Paenibacillus sp. sgz500958]|uniref:MerR family transcriptional regulator n=1 Tax=Paenibacillus sp. sgz500958 TaxID=3242475 RepID=UPI0036D367BD
MKIKEVADKLRISARAIRFYEEKGLISPTKGDNAYREFSEQEIWRLQTIISLRESGMPVEDIRKALEQIEGQDHEELQYYLELQRSVLFAKWVEIKHIIDTTDYMIDMVKERQNLPLDDFYSLAEGSRRLREHLGNWQDKWNYDRRAGMHDEEVLNEREEYKDYETALALTAGRVDPVAGEKGLDIGTGTGNLAGRLMALGADMAGVDQSKEMLKECRRKFPTMETKLGNFLALPYLDGRFDFAVSSFAFRHLSENQQALALGEIRRVLKPHGRICITDLMVTDEAESNIGPDTPYAPLSKLLALFEEMGYLTQHQRVNEQLYIIFAVPIR